MHTDELGPPINLKEMSKMGCIGAELKETRDAKISPASLINHLTTGDRILVDPQLAKSLSTLLI